MSAAKKKKSKENKELKLALCDISKRLSSFEKIDKKLEELVDYCCNDQDKAETRR